MPTSSIQSSSFVTNSYSGNINPGKSSRSKLYIKATKELSKETKIKIKFKNANKFIDQVHSNANKFGRGHLLFQVQTGSNP